MPSYDFKQAKNQGLPVALEELLNMKVTIEDGDGKPVQISPDFRIAVQEILNDGVRIIIHASGHDSETLDFIVQGNELFRLEHFI